MVTTSETICPDSGGRVCEAHTFTTMSLERVTLKELRDMGDSRWDEFIEALHEAETDYET